MKKSLFILCFMIMVSPVFAQYDYPHKTSPATPHGGTSKLECGSPLPGGGKIECEIFFLRFRKESMYTQTFRHVVPNWKK